MVCAFDFECEYSDSINVKVQGNQNYARLTKVFLVSLFSPELGIEYVGPPELAPWPTNGVAMVAHNVGFDSAVYKACQAKGDLPNDLNPLFVCSADLSAYMLLGRNLKDVVKAAYNVELSKSIRNRAKNKGWPQDFKPAQQEDFKRYCLEDAKYSYRLWKDFSAEWPENERRFAEIIRVRANEGVAIDQGAVAQGVERLSYLRELAERKIPWAGNGGTVLSMARVREYCVLEQIPPPASLAEDSIECTQWEQRFGDKYPLIGFLRAWRKANMYLRKLELMQSKLMPNGRMCFGLKYYGAEATGRLSGEGGWNIQNLPRVPYEEVDVRKLLIPEPGKKFVIADFAAIEPRVTCWITDSPLLGNLRTGHNLYEADARLSGSWNGEPGTLKKTDPNLYQLQKAQTLGISYGMGSHRLKEAARVQLSLDLDLSQCAKIIDRWHVRNPGVRKKWKQLERDFRDSTVKKETYSITLPSGRKLRYFNPEHTGDKIVASPTQGPRRKFYWGGAVFENVVQAIARDVLRDAVLRIEAAGIPVIFTAHDEVVCEVPLDFNETEIKHLMLVPPDWARDLPLGVEVISSQNYLK